MADAETSFFAALRDANRDDWESYTNHPFVRRLADGTLPEAAFRHYLVQDYLFLIQFARAYGLAAYKSDNLEEIRSATEGLKAIIDVEIGLHVSYCEEWGLPLRTLESAGADRATVAYTRYVLDRGMTGDLLDLRVALAPCIVGYGAIGAHLAADSATKLHDNPYAGWIAMYAGEEYQRVAETEMRTLDDLAAKRGGAARFEALAAVFRTATQLETAFWQMGLESASDARAPA
jgi:thiaminase/transcriptional activator TenA